jgi:hypothetical protein
LAIDNHEPDIRTCGREEIPVELHSEVFRLGRRRLAFKVRRRKHLAKFATDRDTSNGELVAANQLIQDGALARAVIAEQVENVEWLDHF